MPETSAPTNGRIRRPALWAGLLLFASLFTPWWMATGDVPMRADPGRNPTGFADVFLPAFSPLMTSVLGAKLANHAAATLTVLVASLVALGLATFLRRRPALTAALAWGSVVLNGVALIAFSALFPRIAYVGHVFWPLGNAQGTFLLSEFHISWNVMPGIFLAAAGLLLQAHFALHATLGWSLSVPSTLLPSRLQGTSTRLAAVLLASAVVGAGLWWGVGAVGDVPASRFAREWDFEYKSFEPGEVAVITGVVTSRMLLSTTYGPYTILDLDGQQYLIALPGDQTEDYRVGASARVPVHFETYWWNDQPYTWADEGFAPVPMLTAFTTVFGAVSFVSGIYLPYEGGISRLVVRTANAFTLDAFNLSVVDVHGPPYLGESGVSGFSRDPRGVVDWMDALAPGPSASGLVNFTDSNANGALDWGDSFELNFPPAQDRHLDSFMLRLDGPVRGFGWIPVGDRGPFLIDLQASLPSPRPNYFLRVLPDQVTGSACSSHLDVTHTLGTLTPPSSLRLQVIHNNSVIYEGPADAVGTGSIARFVDARILGSVDEGDSWILDNLVFRGRYEVRIIHQSTESQISGASWVCGVGSNIAAYPRLTLGVPAQDPLDTDQTSVAVNAVVWVLAGELQSYRAFLLRNGTAILGALEAPVRLIDLPQTSNDGMGTILDFTDVDGDGYLRAGDYLSVTGGSPRTTYELVVFYNDHEVTSVTWST